MKRRIISAVLVFVYILLTAVVILPFFAHTYIEKAEDAKDSYNWSKALPMYQKALRLDPFNAEHLKKYADFLVIRSMFQVDKTASLELSKALYKKAIKLNKDEPTYYLALGKVYIEIMKAKGGINKNQEEFSLAVENFKKALEKDPNRLASTEYIYQIVVANIDDLKLVESLTPSNLYAYQRLYNYIKRANLWQLRKALIDKINYYTKIENPEDFEKTEKERIERLEAFKKEHKEKLTPSNIHSGWIGTQGPYKGKNGGNMYWTGRVDSVLMLPSGKQIIKIKAQATPAKDIWPYIIVELDGQVVGELFVNSLNGKEYSFSVNTNGGLKVLSVTFANDGGGMYRGVKEDRNLFLGSVHIDNIQIEKEGRGSF